MPRAACLGPGVKTGNTETGGSRPPQIKNEGKEEALRPFSSKISKHLWNNQHWLVQTQRPESQPSSPHPWFKALLKVTAWGPGSQGWYYGRWIFAPHTEEYSHNENCLKTEWVSWQRALSLLSRGCSHTFQGSYQQMCTSKKGWTPRVMRLPICRRWWFHKGSSTLGGGGGSRHSRS